MKPKYSLSPLEIAYLTSTIFFGWPKRSLRDDARHMLDHHKPRPMLTGLENIPQTGGFLLVANHHQRPGMWIGWPGGVVADAVATLRNLPEPIRIVVTDSQRMTLFGAEFVMPLSRWFLGRIARAWGMIPIPADSGDKGGHAATLRTCLRLLREGEGVLFFPEGERGTAGGLIEALPGTGTFMLLAAKRAPVLPCAFWEEGEQLRAQIGAPIPLTTADDAAAREQVMRAIAALLPSSMRGIFSDHKETQA